MTQDTDTSTTVYYLMTMCVIPFTNLMLSIKKIIHIFSSYRPENTLLLHYKSKPGESSEKQIYLFYNHTKEIRTPCRYVVKLYRVVGIATLWSRN